MPNDLFLVIIKQLRKCKEKNFEEYKIPKESLLYEPYTILSCQKVKKLMVGLVLFAICIEV